MAYFTDQSPPLYCAPCITYIVYTAVKQKHRYRSAKEGFISAAPKFPEFQLASHILLDLIELIPSRKCACAGRQIFGLISVSEVPGISISSLYLVEYNRGDRVQEAPLWWLDATSADFCTGIQQIQQGLDFSQACQFTIFSAPLPALKNLQTFSLNFGRASQSTISKAHYFWTAHVSYHLPGFVKRNWSSWFHLLKLPPSRGQTCPHISNRRILKSCSMYKFSRQKHHSSHWKSTNWNSWIKLTL